MSYSEALAATRVLVAQVEAHTGVGVTRDVASYIENGQPEEGLVLLVALVVEAGGTLTEEMCQSLLDLLPATFQQLLPPALAERVGRP